MQLKRLVLNGESATDRMNKLREELSTIVSLPAHAAGASGDSATIASKTTEGGENKHADIDLPGLHVKAD